MFTKDVFMKMKEAELRTQVVIPLLRAMGFQDVFDFHGGSGEQGKDIVCWKPGDLGTRVNYAIVLKAGPISGKAQPTKGTAGEVLIQVSQCFGSYYPDPVTTEPQKAHQCWVVTNGRITKEALTSIQSALSGQKLDRFTSFVNSDELWELVLKYLKNQTVLERLSEASDILDSLDTHYTVQTTVNGPNIYFTLAEKFPGAAEQKPVNFNVNFAFPNTLEGKAMREKFEEHIKTGAFPLTIPPEFIQKIEVPDFLRNIFPNTEKDQPILEIGGPVDPPKVLLKLEFTNEDGNIFTLDRILFIQKQSGTDETTLVSKPADIPLEITLIAKISERSATFTFRILGGDKNASQLLSALRLQTCLSKPFVLRITNMDDNIVLFESSHPSGFEPPDARFVDFVVDMAEIQQKIKLPIIIPSRDFNGDEISAINVLRTILHNGKIPVHGVVNLSAFSRGIPSIMEILGNGQEDRVMFGADEVIELFGTKIPIGKVQYKVKVQMINEQEVNEMYTNAPDSDTPIDVQLKIVEDGNTYFKEYLDWLPKTDNSINPKLANLA